MEESDHDYENEIYERKDDGTFRLSKQRKLSKTRLLLSSLKPMLVH